MAKAHAKTTRVLADLTEEECYLLAILQDQSGIDQAEFSWRDETSADGLFRCWDFQYAWYRCTDKQQIDQCARAIGKSVGIQMRAWAFAFANPQKEMLITAPELIHLDPVTAHIEDRILGSRLSKEFLKTDRTNSNGIKHRPFEVNFRNNAKIIGRIPQKDGKGVKGMHPHRLEQDEAQDYPEPGWTELGSTLKFADSDAIWRAHGVSRGVRDMYYSRTQKESGWTVHRFTAMHRPDWSAGERAYNVEYFGGSKNSPDYRRNVLGLHGDAQSPLFVLSELMACVDIKVESDYNSLEYYHVEIRNERLEDSGLDIVDMLDFPESHKAYDRVWVGMDVGLTNHPTEILIAGEETLSRGGGEGRETGKMQLKVIARIHLERISSPLQRKVLGAIYDFYRPKGIAMDRTGLGLPIWQEIQLDPDTPAGMVKVMRPYNFSEKIIVGFEKDDRDEDAPYDPDWEPTPIMGNVLEYSSDMLRYFVSKRELKLPYDTEMLREFQGQTYATIKTVTDPYGKKKFNVGKFHALDAARMLILGHLQEFIEAMKEVEEDEAVLDMFLTA